MKRILLPARTFVLLGAVVLLGPTFTGCGLVESTTEDEETFDAVTEIHLDAGSASFDITGDDVDETSVRREMHHRWGGEPDDSTTVTDGVLTLDGCGRNCRVDYTVVVPAGTPVRGHTSNGTIETTDLGPVDLASSNGAIEVRGAGPIVAETSNGRIVITLRDAADVSATTSNGSIEVAVPDTTYRVGAETSNGTVDIGVAESAEADHLLRLRTSNGDVSVMGRGPTD